MAEEPELCYLRALASELNLQRKNGTHCDCHVVVQGSTFKAHRNVLFAASPHVRALLRGQAERPGQVVVIHLDIVTAAGFAAILDYMYSGRVILSSRNMIEVMSAASYLQMTELVRLCDHYIRTSFKDGSVPTEQSLGLSVVAPVLPNAELPEGVSADGGAGAEGDAEAVGPEPVPVPPVRKGRGRPRKSRHSVRVTKHTPAHSSDNDESEHAVAYDPNRVKMEPQDRDGLLDSEQDRIIDASGNTIDFYPGAEFGSPIGGYDDGPSSGYHDSGAGYGGCTPGYDDAAPGYGDAAQDYGEEAAPDYDDPTVDYDGSAPDYDDGAAPPDYDDGAPPLHGYGDVDGMDVSGMAVPLDGGVGDEEEEDGGEDGEEGDGAGAHAGHAGGSPGCFTYTILTENLTAAGEGGGTGRMFGTGWG